MTQAGTRPSNARKLTRVSNIPTDVGSTGNRISQTTDGVTTQTLVNRNRLLSDGTYDYTYDGNGNRTRKLEIATGEYQDFTWDHRNRLTHVEFFSTGGTLLKTVRYSYDAFDQRILTEVDTDADGTFETTARAVWDRGEVSLVLDETGNVEHRFLHGPGVDQVFADESATDGLLWYLTDNQNSVRDVVDSSGTLVNHLSYSTFGKITSESDDTKTPYFAYTGREYDEETNLQYNRARYYDAETGRWLNNDPIRFAAGDTNIQRYVENSPTNYTDPSGLYPRGGDTNSNEGKREQAIPILERIAQIEEMLRTGKFSRCNELTPYAERLLRRELRSLYVELDKLLRFFPDPNSDTAFLNNQLNDLEGSKRLKKFAQEMSESLEEFGDHMKEHFKDRAIEAAVAAAGGVVLSEALDLASDYMKARKRYKRAKDAAEAASKRPRFIYDAGTGRYRDMATGRFVAHRDLPFPGNRGFASSKSGIVSPSTRIDRYGRPSGRFASDPSATISQRGLPAGSEALQRRTYEVVKPLQADIGPAAGVREFGATGGGTQYFFKRPIDQLVRDGFLREIP